MSKHFLSVLGTGGYSNAIYYCGEKRYETSFVQEALLRLKFEEWQPGDKITIFLTEASRKRNWMDRAYDSKEVESALSSGQVLPKMRIGLAHILEKDFGPFLDDADVSMIPIGKDEAELWEIFQVIFDRIRNDEELYIDITHALRNIPIQMLAVIAYARVIKNVQVNGIYYGAFEAGTKNEQGIIEAPIMDLLTFLDILDWSQAANLFVKYGNSDQISELYHMQKAKNRTEIKRMRELDKVIKEIQNITHGLEASRGYYDMKQSSRNKNGKSALGAYKQYKDAYQIMTNKDRTQNERHRKQKNIIEPLGELLNVIDEKVDIFDVETNFDMGMAAIQWAIDNKRTQQGFTALEETMKTFLCNRFDFDETKESNRDGICKDVCNMLFQKRRDLKITELSPDIRERAYEEWINSGRWGAALNLDSQKKVKELFQIVPENLLSLCSDVSRCRNSMNHFGYSNIGEFSSNDLDQRLEKYFAQFQAIVSMDIWKNCSKR